MHVPSWCGRGSKDTAHKTSRGGDGDFGEGKTAVSRGVRGKKGTMLAPTTIDTHPPLVPWFCPSSSPPLLLSSPTLRIWDRHTDDNPDRYICMVAATSLPPPSSVQHRLLQELLPWTDGRTDAFAGVRDWSCQHDLLVQQAPKIILEFLLHQIMLQLHFLTATKRSRVCFLVSLAYRQICMEGICLLIWCCLSCLLLLFLFGIFFSLSCFILSSRGSLIQNLPALSSFKRFSNGVWFIALALVLSSCVYQQIRWLS